MISNNYTLNFSIPFQHQSNRINKLPKIRDALMHSLCNVESPCKMLEEQKHPLSLINQLDDTLRALRSMLSSAKSAEDYFSKLIYGIRAFRVANCSEIAEFAKLMLKANGVDNCDIFCLGAKSPNLSQEARIIDQTIVALDIPNGNNNKRNLTPFIPTNDTLILDIWSDGFIGNISEARHKYSSSLGLKPNEELVFYPINTFEPNKEILDFVKKQYPMLIIT